MTHDLLHTVANNMFQLPVPVLEKILRPMIMYIVLVALLRAFGKRELAQLNPFDLVVLLTLSNTVQNAIIGNDNSVSGGIIGAIALLSCNWVVSWLLFRWPRVNRALEGSATVLIREGVVDKAAQRREHMSDEEIITVLNRNNYNEPAEVDICRLDPGGTFYVRGRKPSEHQVQRKEMLAAVDRMSDEIRLLREQLGGRA